ncbi:hypothetical protein A6A08_22485 [Nocardiopsis sp. TSRI0078]|uniref:hypothetical protein n=1 Tax=unclassified Nocardiopsis TaxID=2649073 RepID=UPI00093CD411|nr:hypothetical protein [Nocardiopsis sp. TSRI0078]OKI20746.1 hypothetical protein A6A08_22485 [Nocardiopsis sp. TSRI0078]
MERLHGLLNLVISACWLFLGVRRLPSEENSSALVYLGFGALFLGIGVVWLVRARRGKTRDADRVVPSTAD